LKWDRFGWFSPQACRSHSSQAKLAQAGKEGKCGGRRGRTWLLTQQLNCASSLFLVTPLLVRLTLSCSGIYKRRLSHLQHLHVTEIDTCAGAPATGVIVNKTVEKAVKDVLVKSCGFWRLQRGPSVDCNDRGRWRSHRLNERASLAAYSAPAKPQPTAATYSERRRWTTASAASH